MHQRTLLAIAVIGLVQAGCGGGGGGGSTGATSVAPSTVSGTVPGTVVEAFCDNGSYYKVDSVDDGSARHPFELAVRSGVGCHLVMRTNEATPEEVITPIGFRDSQGRVRTRLTLGQGEQVDLGHVPLHMSRNESASDDLDDDGVLDDPLVLDDVGASNPLSQTDVDDDDVNDWDDSDHGGYHYDQSTADPQDHDDDGIPNVYDSDHIARPGDSDGDGLPDSVDANPYNDEHHDNDDLDDDCDDDGYHDEDRDHDGYYDDDSDRDGYHDDDSDHDGRHDDEDDDDGVCGNGSAPVTDNTPPPAPTPPPTQVPTPPPTSAPPPSPTADGARLYATECARCHGQAPNTNKGGSSAGSIQSAINNNVGGMGAPSLRALTAAEVQAIADFLAPL